MSMSGGLAFSLSEDGKPARTPTALGDNPSQGMMPI